MNDLKTKLSALMIEYRFTHSRKALHEVSRLAQKIESPKDLNTFRSFFLNGDRS